MYVKDWNIWARLVLNIFPNLKKVDTSTESKAIDTLINMYLEIDNLPNRKLKVVDVCCGWGRHCLELNHKYLYNMIGLDISKVFIKYANKVKKEERNSNFYPCFILTDLFDYIPDERFDVALNLWTSFGLYEEDNLNIKMLQKINEYLKVSGLLILDVANGERLIRKLSSINDGDFVKGNKEWWRVKDKICLEMLTQINKSIVEYSLIVFNKLRTLGESRINLKMYTSIKLKELLEKAGFLILHEYGDFALNDFAKDSPRYIVVAKKQ